jgi:uncharacterized membrane protein
VSLSDALTVRFQNVFKNYVATTLSIDVTSIIITGVTVTTRRMLSSGNGAGLRLLVSGVQLAYTILVSNTNEAITASKVASTNLDLTKDLTTNGYFGAYAVSSTLVPTPTANPTPAPTTFKSKTLPAGSIAAAVILTVLGALLIVGGTVFCFRMKQRKAAEAAESAVDDQI